MFATVDSFTSVVETPKPVRPRAPRKSGDQAAKVPAASVAKSKDASMTKVSLYLPVAVAKKLDVAAVIQDKDKSDIVAALLARELSSVTFYDRATRPTDQSLTVGEIGSEAAA
ncbi:MAG TPA: hypothetical protein VKP69_21020 [Isosphaeraceae bacterium]|nr:hypothetical protein [Isosphaeraceae bacterium]